MTLFLWEGRSRSQSYDPMHVTVANYEALLEPIPKEYKGDPRLEAINKAVRELGLTDQPTCLIHLTVPRELEGAELPIESVIRFTEIFARSRYDAVLTTGTPNPTLGEVVYVSKGLENRVQK